jgi:tRNA threonylcarbamoyladenosine biosynthesis protein TsaE
MKPIVLPNLEATNKLGLSLAKSIDESALIGLSGPVGTGKTTLVKALARGFNISQIVNSPTFVIMNEYIGGRLPLYHLDFYRFADGLSAGHDLALLAVEVEELCQRPGVVVIEWPEYFRIDDPGSEFLDGRDHLKIGLNYAEEADDMRLASIEAVGSSANRVVNNLFKLAKDMFIYS